MKPPALAFYAMGCNLWSCVFTANWHTPHPKNPDLVQATPVDSKVLVLFVVQNDRISFVCQLSGYVAATACTQ